MSIGSIPIHEHSSFNYFGCQSVTIIGQWVYFTFILPFNVYFYRELLNFPEFIFRTCHSSKQSLFCVWFIYFYSRRRDMWFNLFRETSWTADWAWNLTKRSFVIWFKPTKRKRMNEIYQGSFFAYLLRKPFQSGKFVLTFHKFLNYLFSGRL